MLLDFSELTNVGLVLRRPQESLAPASLSVAQGTSTL